MRLRSVLIVKLVATVALYVLLTYAFAASASATDTNVQKSAGMGWLEYKQGLRVLHLQGSPYEMGYQQGALLKDELAEVAQLFSVADKRPTKWPGRIWGFVSGIYQKAVLLSRAKREIPSTYIEEMRGISAGSDGVVDLDTLVLLQYFYEAMNPNGSSIAVLNDDSPRGHVLHGYNLEGSWPAELWDLVTVTIYQPEEGEAFVSVGWPGMVGVIQGMNTTGVSLTFGTALFNRAPEPPAVPGLIIARDALQHATNAQEVFSTFSDWPRQGGAVVTVAEANNRAIAIEYTDQRIATRKAENNLLLTTPYFLTPALLPITRSESYWGETRLKRMQELLNLRQQTTLTTLVGVLRDRQDYTTKLDDFYEYGVANQSVITSTLFNPNMGWLWVARATLGAPAPFNRYIAINLWAELGNDNGSTVNDIAASPLLQYPTGTALMLYRKAYQSYISSSDTVVRWSNMVEWLEQSVTADAAAAPLYLLGIAYMNTARTSSAIRVLTQAALSAEAHPYWQKRSLLALGELYMKEEKTVLAAASLKQALSISIPLGPFQGEQSTLDVKIKEYLGVLKMNAKVQ